MAAHPPTLQVHFFGADFHFVETKLWETRGEVEVSLLPAASCILGGAARMDERNEGWEKVESPRVTKDNKLLSTTTPLWQDGICAAEGIVVVFNGAAYLLHLHV